MTPLPVNFASFSTSQILPMRVGYTRCMIEMLKYLSDKDAEDDKIDVDEVRQLIYATNAKLMKLESDEEIENQLQSLTKTTNP